MKPLTWQDRLDRALTELEVVEIARDFLATLDYVEVGRLPAVCRPRKLFAAADVSAYALDLVRHQGADDDSASAEVVRLAAFFSQASMRLSKILMRTNDEEAGDVAKRTA